MPRYTDFLVNEILPSGQVLHLEDIAAPKQKQTVKAQPPVETAPAETVAKPVENGNAKAEDTAPESTSNGVNPARAEQITAEENDETTSEERKNAAIAAVREHRLLYH